MATNKYVGVNLFGWDKDKPANVPILKQLPKRWYLDTNNYTPDGINFNFNPLWKPWKLDDIIAFSKGQPFTLCFQKNYTGIKERPMFNQKNDPNDPASYAPAVNHAKALVTQYKGLTFEPGNELDASWNGCNMSGTHHAVMMCAVHQAAMAIDPTCTIVFPGLALSFWDKQGIKFFQEIVDYCNAHYGGVMPFHRMAIHLYSDNGKNAVPLNINSGSGACLEAIRFFIKHNYPNVDLTVNEVGLSMVSGTYRSVAPVAGEDIAVTSGKMLGQYIQYLTNVGDILPDIYLYNWSDANDGDNWDAHCGLVYNTGSATDIYRPALQIALDFITKNGFNKPNTVPVKWVSKITSIIAWLKKLL